MKRNNYKLKIDNHCDQEWSLMTENKIGKFCLNCSKTVIDFTHLTDKEIIQIIEQASGKICARLTEQQLNKQLLQPCNRVTNSSFYKILAGLLVMATTKSSFATASYSQKEIVSIKESSKSIAKPTHSDEVELPSADTLKNVVQGKVIDKLTKDALPSASVIIKDTKIGVASDRQGNFKLIIPDTLLTEKIILRILYIGYETSDITIDRKDLPLKKELTLTPRKAIMGEVVIIKRNE